MFRRILTLKFTHKFGDKLHAIPGKFGGWWGRYRTSREVRDDHEQVFAVLKGGVQMRAERVI
jgi:hypothetical protein